MSRKNMRVVNGIKKEEMKRILYYYEIPRGIDENGINRVEPVLTFDVEEARDKQGSRQANYEDLFFEVAASGDPYEGLLQIEEGIYKWCEWFEEENAFGDSEFNCGYRKVA